MEAKLTKAQRLFLAYLDTRRGSIGPVAIGSQRIAMLRRPEERGLVGRTAHGYWLIRAAGRAALAKEGGGDV